LTETITLGYTVQFPCQFGLLRDFDKWDSANCNSAKWKDTKQIHITSEIMRTVVCSPQFIGACSTFTTR